MRKLFLIFLLVFFLFPIISAVEFNLSSSYKSGETVIARISGNFLTAITKDNVFFYQGHVRIPVEYDVAKLDEDYYIYASLIGKTEGNYSISVQNVKYMNGNEIIEGDLERNFTITNETADFSVNPGFVSASSGFSLEMQNLKDNSISVTVKTPAANGSERDISISEGAIASKEISISLKSGEVKDVDFVLGYGYPTFQFIELSSSGTTYEIPVSVYSSNIQTQTLETSFSLEPSEMIVSIPTNSAINRTVYLYNTGDTDITNISLSLSDEIKAFINLSQNHVDNLASKSNIPITLFFFSPGETEADGILKAIVGDTTSYSQISINFLNNYTVTNESTQSYTTKTCAEISGVVCTSTQRCSEDSVYAKDNVCCLGECTANQSTSGSSWTGRIIAIAILVLIIVVGVWFYFKKFKKAKKPVDLLKIGKKD